MTVSRAAVAPWHRANIYKFLFCIVCILIALQYLLNGAFDRKYIENIFTINTSRPPHQRAFVVYDSGVTPSASTGGEENDEVPGPVVGGPGNASGTIAPMSRLGNGSASNTPPLQEEAAHPQPTSLSGNGFSSTPTTVNLTCPSTPPNLVGHVAVSTSPPDLAEMEKAFAKVKQGGKGAPEECQALYRVAIVIPFRDRFQHLLTLLYNLHPMLLRQQLDYQIFVVEQEKNLQFNRATLMNIGFVEALKERPFDCFIFHDVDLLPENDKNIYNCPKQPRHMSMAIDTFNYRLPYADLFGGVSAMRTEHFRLVNGFSNMFWGWGGEDDDMANRLKFHKLHISRYPKDIAQYKMLVHKKEKANPKRYDVLKNGRKRFLTDGLNSLQYEILSKKKAKLYTWFLVRLTPPAQPS
ncbi:beta-1,4-N-acetylgalactosaminyltransferase bre-4 [Copidosoma floridanum]|uniref:beta-1,4-N-acetylgalactosaminyltransferase bre-4 n=1 Tax=Copidosoma floridanum TaxID=29053 RepID=UPI0006C97445|nr:beta-1,4-N-acetylgalactosaminyltransferase bre-4 [Copidosoma floridanum]